MELTSLRWRRLWPPTVTGRAGLAPATMPGPRPRGNVNNISDGFPGMAGMAVMAEEVERCPQCGTIKGGTVAALDALYLEVARLRQLADALDDALAREVRMRREIRLLQETVARLRGGIVTLPTLDILYISPTMISTFPPKGAGVA